MKTYKIKIRLDEQEIKTEIEANNWEELCDYVFGNIQIIDTKEK